MMSFHQLVSDMRLYVRRVYGAELQGPPIPMQKGIWHVWIREPGARRGRMVKVSHAQLRRKTSNDMSRKKAKKIVTRRAFRALRVIYSPANRAYFVMWHTQVLRTFHDKAEAEAYARSLTSHTSNDPHGSGWIIEKWASHSGAYVRLHHHLFDSKRAAEREIERLEQLNSWASPAPRYRAVPSKGSSRDPSRRKKSRRGLLYGLARRAGKRPSDFNPREIGRAHV